MKAVVTTPYERPFENPISVAAGDPVVPDFAKHTDLKGWVWCTAKDGRSGWTPHDWLVQSGDHWHVNRTFNAIELTITPGETLELVFEESGFYWAKKENGETGWVPSENVSVLPARQSPD